MNSAEGFIIRKSDTPVIASDLLSDACRSLNGDTPEAAIALVDCKRGDVVFRVTVTVEVEGYVRSVTK